MSPVPRIPMITQHLSIDSVLICDVDLFLWISPGFYPSLLHLGTVQHSQLLLQQLGLVDDGPRCGTASVYSDNSCSGHISHSATKNIFVWKQIFVRIKIY